MQYGVYTLGLWQLSCLVVTSNMSHNDGKVEAKEPLSGLCLGNAENGVRIGAFLLPLKPVHHQVFLGGVYDTQVPEV